MDQVHVIRHKVLVEGLSERRVARELGVDRKTVRRYLDRAGPERIEGEPRNRPVWSTVGARLEALLTDSPRWTGGKQRLTATRLHAMLREEGHTVGVTLVKEAVAEWKRRRQETFVPLVYRPGELAEVDFFEVLVDVDGKRQKAWMFLMRLMYSGRDFAWLYERQDQVSFLDGHVRAFMHFGAVPQRIAYDNLTPAVARILVGGERKLTIRFEALASHYLFEPSFCRPATGHDKGGVESRGKAIRWQHLVPIPTGNALSEMSAALLKRLDARQATGRDAAGQSIAERFAVEKRAMLPLAHPFDASATHLGGVSRRGLVVVEGAYYSVPCTWAGLDVTVHVGAMEVTIVSRGAEVRHRRLRFGQRSIDYRHFLRELSKKPQAVRQVIPDLLRDLGEPFGAVWRLLLEAHGPRQAARIFAKVLGYVETRGAAAVAATLLTAIEHDEPMLLALAPPVASDAVVAHESLPANLRAVEVESGCAADYDGWLGQGAR